MPFLDFPVRARKAHLGGQRRPQHQSATVKKRILVQVQKMAAKVKEMGPPPAPITPPALLTVDSLSLRMTSQYKGLGSYLETSETQDLKTQNRYHR